jgi:putative inorganic carbon (hco3(-)) transporter
MAARLLNRIQGVRTGAILIALALAALAGCAPLLWNDARAPLLVLGTAFATLGAIFLLQRPLASLYVALFLGLLPLGLRIEPVYTIGSNLAVVLALCAWLLRAGFQRRLVHWNAVCVLLLAYMAWASFSLIWAPDLLEARAKLAAYGIGVALLFLSINQIRSLAAVDGLMRVLGLIGWIMVLGGLHALFFSSYHFGERLEVLAMNQNQYPMFLILMIPGSIWPVIRAEGGKRAAKLVLSILFILCTLLLVALSGSRGGTISLLLMLLAFWFWKPVRPWGVVGVALMAISLTSAPFLLDTLSNRFNEQEGGAFGGRDVLWRASLLLIQDHPFTGVGVGNGPFELHGYIVTLTNYYNYRHDLPSHNPLLEVGVETGLLGMLIYIGALCCALWLFLRHHGDRRENDAALAAYFPIVLGVAAGYLSSWFKSGGMENHFTFFLLLMLLAIPSQLAADHASQAAPIAKER